MKKFLSVIRILFVLIFIASFVLLILNTFKVNESKKQIQDILGKEISYFNDESFLDKNNYKFKDADNIEYWVDKHTDRFYYLYNPSAENINTAISKKRAIDIAYEAAMKWDIAFFKQDTVCEITDKSYYEFNIFQIDKSGFKTGKFIVVKVSSDEIEYIAMHTHKNHVNPELGNCISEKKAIETAYSMTKETDTALDSNDNHLVKANLVKIQGHWTWEVTIWEIAADSINDKAESIDTDKYFVCTISAISSKVLDYAWTEELG